MAIDVVQPYAPSTALAGGVVDGKAIVVAPYSSTDLEVTVFDPAAKSVRVGRTPLPAGYGATWGRYGATIGSEVWVGRSSGTAQSMTLAAVSSDMSVVFHPSVFTLYSPSVLAVGSQIWVFHDSWVSGAYSPRVFDTSSLTWVTGHGMAAIALSAQPVYGGGYIWGLSGGALYRWNPSTFERTTVIPSGVSTSGQVAVSGTFAYWAASTSLTRLDMTSGAITTQTMGVSFPGTALVLGSDAALYSYSPVGAYGAIRSFHPVTGQSASRFVAVSGYTHIGFRIGSDLVFPGR